MANRWTVLTIASIFLMGGAERASAWSEEGVRLFIEKAIDALDNEIEDFYEERELTLIETATDPSIFSQRMIFEIDRLEPFPFLDVPTDRTRATRKYGAEALEEAGDVPWRLIDSYRALVAAFEASDFEKVDMHSAEVAHYVGAMYVPVNVSKDGDGEPTAQHGLRERFDSRLMEVYAREVDIDTPTAIYLDRPEDYAISIPRRSYVWVDNILYFDYLSRLGVKSYDRYYYEGMWLKAEPLLEQLLTSAALDTASFWYTAWVTAKRPALPKK